MMKRNPEQIIKNGVLHEYSYDTHNNICALINPITKKLVAEYTFTAFGEEQRIRESLFNPWRYAAKRLDSEINLIY